MAETAVASKEQLSDEDRAVIDAGKQAFLDDLWPDVNPHSNDLAAPGDERLALLWRQGWNAGWEAWHADLKAATEKARQDKPFKEYLAELEAECAARQSAHLDLKEQASEAKKSYEAAVIKLRSAVAQLTKGDPEPLFNQPTPDAPATDAIESQTDSDAWRKFGIDRLGLKESINAKLADADVLTIGDLEDLRGGKGLRSVAGIGQATVDKIEDALLAWLSENRDSAALQDAA